MELFYWNKKEAIALLQNNGLQLSKTLPQDMRFHNLKYIEKVADNIGSLTHKNGAETTSDVSTTTYSISDLYEFVKTYEMVFKLKTEKAAPHNIFS